MRGWPFGYQGLSCIRYVFMIRTGFLFSCYMTRQCPGLLANWDVGGTGIEASSLFGSNTGGFVHRTRCNMVTSYSNATDF